MLQKVYDAFERDYSCEICGQIVTNPLCPVCLTIEIEAWLTLYPNLRSELIPRLYRYLERTEHRISNASQCIKCKSKRAFICPYCFTEHVLHELRKLKSNRIILKEFLQFFNFDFDHTGYSKDAEKLGII